MWVEQPILTLRDTGGANLEEQLPVLVRTLETGDAEAQWARKEEERRDGIRRIRWEEVKKEAITKLAYERNAQRLRDELARRDPAAAMIAYADDITAHAAELGAPDAGAALEWASWIRQNAERISPLNGPLHVLEVTSCSHRPPAAHERLEHLRTVPALDKATAGTGGPRYELASPTGPRDPSRSRPIAHACGNGVAGHLGFGWRP
jgi:hypothetical protein